MKARLGVEYWVKRIALSVKHSLRHYSKVFFSNYGMDWENVSAAWNDNDELGGGCCCSIPVQILVAGVHVMWGRKRSSSHYDTESLQQDLLQLKTECVNDLVDNHYHGKNLRAQVKLHLVDYYTEILEKNMDDTVTYRFDERNSVLKVTALNKTYVYGHEYLGQSVNFNASLTQGREIHQCLQNVVQRFSSLMNRGLNSKSVGQVAGLFGKFLQQHTYGFGNNLKNVVIGTIILGSWLTLGSFDCYSQEESEFVRLLALRIQGQELFSRNSVELLGKEIRFKSDFHICLSAWGQDHQMAKFKSCLLYTSPSPRDRQKSRMPSSA